MRTKILSWGELNLVCWPEYVHLRTHNETDVGRSFRKTPSNCCCCCQIQELHFLFIFVMQTLKKYVNIEEMRIISLQVIHRVPFSGIKM